jgi:hypothetical protein
MAPESLSLEENITCSKWFQQHPCRFDLGRGIGFYNTLCACVHGIGVVVERTKLMPATKPAGLLRE